MNVESANKMFNNYFGNFFTLIFSMAYVILQLTLFLTILILYMHSYTYIASLFLNGAWHMHLIFIPMFFLIFFIRTSRIMYLYNSLIIVLSSVAFFYYLKNGNVVEWYGDFTTYIDVKAVIFVFIFSSLSCIISLIYLFLHEKLAISLREICHLGGRK